MALQLVLVDSHTNMMENHSIDWQLLFLLFHITLDQFRFFFNHIARDINISCKSYQYIIFLVAINVVFQFIQIKRTNVGTVKKQQRENRKLNLGKGKTNSDE